MNAVESSFFISGSSRQWLRHNSREHFDIKLPSSFTVLLLRLPLRFKNANVDLKAGHVPIFQPLSQFHLLLLVSENPYCLHGGVPFRDIISRLLTIRFAERAMACSICDLTFAAFCVKVAQLVKTE